MSIDSDGYFVRMVQFPHTIRIVISVFISDYARLKSAGGVPSAVDSSSRFLRRNRENSTSRMKTILQCTPYTLQDSMSLIHPSPQTDVPSVEQRVKV